VKWMRGGKEPGKIEKGRRERTPRRKGRRSLNRELAKSGFRVMQGRHGVHRRGSPGPAPSNKFKETESRKLTGDNYSKLGVRQ